MWPDRWACRNASCKSGCDSRNTASWPDWQPHYALTKHVNGKRGGEYTIALLVSIINLCTANNTVAIITTGGIARKIGERFHLDPRKCASLLDTFSCAVQGLLPYGAQVLMAAGLASVSPIAIIPWLYYPMAIGIAAFLSIMFRYPKRYS